MTKLYEVDQGREFGKWTDPVSRLMYETSLHQMLPDLRLGGRVADYGGANGLLKKACPFLDITSIDVDESKQPDIVADILTHDDPYDVGFCRYVLHYLTDQQVIQFVDNVNVPRLIIVQFCNEDLRTKYANSKNEEKYFRTYTQTQALLPAGTRNLWRRNYVVTPQFYKNRLGMNGGIAHEEEIHVFEVVK